MVQAARRRVEQLERNSLSGKCQLAHFGSDSDLNPAHNGEAVSTSPLQETVRMSVPGNSVGSRRCEAATLDPVTTDRPSGREIVFPVAVTAANSWTRSDAGP